jgi:NitT/TauT family transport system substrate-binding protein
MRSTPSRRTFLATVPLLGVASTRAANAQASPVIRVGANATDGFCGALFARDMGFFQKAGLDVDVQTFGNGSQQNTAMAGGAIDIGISTVTAVANAVLHGIPWVYIAGGSMYVSAAPAGVLAVAKDSPYKTAGDLVGKTVAVSAFKDGTHLAIAAFLTKNNVDLAKVNFIEMPYPLMAQAVERGTVDGAVLVEPFASGAANDVRIVAKPLDALGSEFLLSGYFTTKAWLNANMQLAKRFTAVMYETARWANANHQKSGELLQKYSKVDPAAIARMGRAVYAESLTPGLIDPTLEWASRVKFTERRVTAAELIAKMS